MAGAGAGAAAAAAAAADDDVVEVSCGGDGRDPGAYAAVLKRRLDLYCAAVAKSMVRFLLRQRSAPFDPLLVSLVFQFRL